MTYNYEGNFFDNQVPKKYKNASLENLVPELQSLREFGEKWASNPKSLFLVGGVGAGKTYFAFALIREMFRRCPRIRWVKHHTSPELDSLFLEAIKSSNGDRWEIMEKAKEEFLFIDDIGREMKSDRLRRQYFELINYRYNNELPTILTSNYSLDQLSELIDPSIASRIQEWQTLEFGTKDLRKSMEFIDRI